MTLRKFEDTYRDAVQKLPECHMDVKPVLDEDRHAQFVATYTKCRGDYRAWMRTAAVAACLFILCGVGTVTAMNYRKGIITVEETGYSITSQKAAEGGRHAVAAADYDNGAAMAGSTEQAAYDDEKEEAYQKYIESIASKEAQDEFSSETNEAGSDELKVMETEMTEPICYSSIEEFRTNEDITVAIPAPELLGGEFEEQNIMVMDEGIYVSLMFYSEEKRFGLIQQDTRSYEQYASSTTYIGASVNERELVNNQGLNYVVFDTMEDGEIVSTHAVISVNGRDLCLDFYGYEENVIEDVLKQLDLSIYFQD